MSGIGATAAIVVAFVAMKHERDAHQEATLRLDEQVKRDREREQAQARRAAEMVDFTWEVEYVGDEPRKIQFTSLANGGPNAFYRAQFAIVDRSGGQVRARAEVGKLAAEEDLTVRRPPKPHRSEGIETELSWGPNETLWKKKTSTEQAKLFARRLGVDLKREDPLPFDIVLEYVDISGDRWRRTADKPPELVV